MAILKRAKTSYASQEIEALNIPTGWEEINLDRIKIASISKGKNENFGGFDIKEAIDKNPDFLFVKVFAIKEDEVNDYFGKEELIKSAHTFIGVPVFTNHQNKDVEKAKGKVVHAWYDEKKGGVYIISAVDKIAYPQLARSIEQNYTTGTSMGTAIEFSICSICHKKAAVEEEYCQCIKNRKNRIVNCEVECAYHSSPSNPQDECPICKCKKGESKKLKHADQKVFEYNYGLKFIEDSFVVNPACHECSVEEIIRPEKYLKKVASIIASYKEISEIPASSCRISAREYMEKTAGKTEIGMLHNIMDTMEKVAKSMFAQKQNVSLDYVSTLIKIAADLQGLIDELTDMGYIQLPSPASLETSTLPETNKEIPPKTIEVKPPAPVITNTPSSSIEDVPNIGSVIGPRLSEISSKIKTAEQVEEKKKEFLELVGNLINKVNEINKEIKMSSSNQEKTASDTSVITEKQLSEKQTDKKIEVVTEKQLDGKIPSDVSTKPANRAGTDIDVITEKQLEAVKTGWVIRWADAPDVITEKQWTETSREIASELSVDQTTVTTEKQLADFLSKHKYNEPGVTTEKQLYGNEKEVVKAAMNILAESIANYGKTASEIVSAVGTINDNPKNYDKAAYLTLVNALPKKKASIENDSKRFGYFSKLSSVNAPAISSIDAVIASSAKNLGYFSADDLFTAMKTVVASKVGLKNVEAIAKDKMDTKNDVVHSDKSSRFASALEEINKSEDGEYLVYLAQSDVKADSKDRVAYLSAIKAATSKQINEKVGSAVEIIVTNVDIDDNKIVVTAKEPKSLTASEKEAFEKLGGSEFKNIKTSQYDRDYRDLEKNIDPSDLDSGSNIDVDIERDEVDQDVVDALFGDDDYDDETKLFDGYEDVVEELGYKVPHSRPKAGDMPTQADYDSKPIRGGKITPELNPADWPADSGDFDGTSLISGRGKEKMMTGPAEQNTELDEGGTSPVIASSKKKVKTAQLFGGEMGGQGGASQAPGAAAALPSGGPADANAPLESLTGSAPAEDVSDDMGDPESDKILPPGTLCPMCGSKDVDVVKGEGRCNNCKSEMVFELSIKVKKAPGLLGDKDSKEEVGGEEEGGNKIPENLPMPAPAAAAAPAGGAAPAPMAAAAKSEKEIKLSWNNLEIEKVDKFSSLVPLNKEVLATLKKNKIKLGSISPITGSDNTLLLGNGKHVCLDTGIPYTVGFKQDKAKKVYAQFTWNPEYAIPCESCKQAKEAFVKDLDTFGMKEADFDMLEMKEKGKVILAMKDKGLLQVIKQASRITSELANAKNVIASFDKNTFPIETCRRKLAARFGMNAVALSGPCEGQAIYDCVCKGLKNAGVYSTSMAEKVASVWMDKTASSECIEQSILSGFDLRQAGVICSGLKAKYAQIDDVAAEEIGADMPEDDNTPPTGPEGMPTPKVDEIPESGEMVTISIPKDLAEELDKALDIQLGENPEEEEHHQEEGAELPVEGEVAPEGEEIPASPEEAVAEEAPVGLESEVGSEVTPEGGELPPVDETKPFQDLMELHFKALQKLPKAMKMEK
jgi:hypothetical protein